MTSLPKEDFIVFHVYVYFREVNEVEREVVVRKNVTNVSASSANVSRTAIQVINQTLKINQHQNVLYGARLRAWAE